MVKDALSTDLLCRAYRTNGKRCRGRPAYSTCSDLCWYHVREYWRKYGWA